MMDGHEKPNLYPFAIVQTDAVERHFVVYAADLPQALASGERIETASRPVVNVSAMLISEKQYDEAIAQFVNGEPEA